MYRHTERALLSLLTLAAAVGVLFSPAPEPFAIGLLFSALLWAFHAREH